MHIFLKKIKGILGSMFLFDDYPFVLNGIEI